MNKKTYPDTCPVCKGTMEAGSATVTVDYGPGVIVVRNVPATVCSQCGEEWIDDAEAERIEKIVEEAKSKKTMVEVLSLSA